MSVREQGKTCYLFNYRGWKVMRVFSRQLVDAPVQQLLIQRRIPVSAAPVGRHMMVAAVELDAAVVDIVVQAAITVDCGFNYLSHI